MYIDKIDNDDNNHNIYHVTFKPYWIERIFGIKEEKTKQYKDTGDTYTYSGGRVYVNQKGRQLGNNFGWGSDVREAIDQWRNSF